MRWRTGVGTLGHTYTRVSHPIPLDKHPRTAMLAVKDNGTVPYLTVGVMGGVKMKNGIWLFESTRPLDPGACQIVRVEARQTPQDVEPCQSLRATHPRPDCLSGVLISAVLICQSCPICRPERRPPGCLKSCDPDRLHAIGIFALKEQRSSQNCLANGNHR